MKPDKVGQVVKLYNPLPEEDPNQLFVVLEVTTDLVVNRAKVRQLNSNISFPPVSVYLTDDLEVVSVSPAEMMGEKVFIRSYNGSEVFGRVSSYRDDSLLLEMSLEPDGIITNCWLQVRDNDGQLHEGFYVYRP